MSQDQQQQRRSGQGASVGTEPTNADRADAGASASFSSATAAALLRADSSSPSIVWEDYYPLTSQCVKALSSKEMDKRKLAALEIEK